jgi:hypothetical protein
MKRALLAAAVIALAWTAAAVARDVDLVTLPPREGVQLTIYNSEDLTLVREVRSITFKRGANRLQFSWANTLIDPTSVYFRPLEQENQIELLDTTFPADRPQVLVWNIQSNFEGQAKVEVSYFTSGISWAADYVLITNPDETQLALDQYVTVVNNSGEDYENAEVRMVVGVVNLVEKIAQLAQAGPMPPEEAKREKLLEVRRAVAKGEAAAMDALAAPGAPAAAMPAKVVKEGLSEYFIFTVEGQRTVRNGWSQRMRSETAREVPFKIVYRYRPHQYGDRPVRFFILANDVEHKMGGSPLPDGMLRVFRENGRDGLNFYVAQQTKYVSIGEKIELNVGADDQVVYERKVLDVGRDNFVYNEDAKPPAVWGWDEKRTWQEEVRNYRAKPIVMEIRHVLDGDVEFRQEDPKAALYDFRTPEYTVTVAPAEKKKWTSDGTFHLGKNAKQNRVRLVP